MPTTTFNLPDGRTLEAGQSFVLRIQVTPELDDYLTFPENWLGLQSDAQLAAFGITRTVTEDAPPLPPTVAELVDFAAERRRYLANRSAVIDVGAREISVWIDAESRTAILGLLPIAQANPDFVLSDWKGADAEFYTLTAAEIIAIWQGGLTFISRCFSAEKAVAALVAAGTITTFNQVEHFSEWPDPAVAAV